HLLSYRLARLRPLRFSSRPAGGTDPPMSAVTNAPAIQEAGSVSPRDSHGVLPRGRIGPARFGAYFTPDCTLTSQIESGSGSATSSTMCSKLFLRSAPARSRRLL